MKATWPSMYNTLQPPGMWFMNCGLPDCMSSTMTQISLCAWADPADTNFDLNRPNASYIEAAIARKVAQVEQMGHSPG